MSYKRINKSQLLITLWLVIGLVLSLIAFRQFVLPIIRAKPPAAPPHLIPPYMRLVKVPDPTLPNQLTVAVMVNTANQETMGADVVVEYDPAVLTIAKEGLKWDHPYAVFQVNQVGQGLVDFSLFSSPHRGEPSFKTKISEEVQLATLSFDILERQAGSTELKIKFVPGKSEESNLILYSKIRPASPIDILQTVEGVSLSL